MGPKTASALVRRYGNVPTLLARVQEVESDTVRAALVGLETELPLWREVARLHDDLPLPPGPRWAPLTAEARGRVREVFERLEFRSLIPRLAALEVVANR